MNGWEEVCFSDLLEEPVRNGIYKPKEYHGNGTKIINMGELFAYPRLTDVAMEKVSLTENEKRKYLVKNGDLIFARRSLTAEGAGKCSIIYNVNEDTVFESSIIRARPNKLKASSLFLFYFFSSRIGKYLLGSILRQVAVAGITGSDLSALSFKIPPLPEQRAIASVLSSLDNKIDLLHRQNATLEAMAEALFKQWFVVEAKEEWENCILGDLIQLMYGKNLKETDRHGGDYPVVGSNGIVGSHDNFLVRGPGIVIGRKGTLGKVILINNSFYPIDTTFYVKTKSTFNALYFLYFLLKSIKFEELNTDSAVPGLNRNIAHSINIKKAPINRIKQFEIYVSPFFKKIKLNNINISNFEKLRDTLLPKLMSGEVRVKY